MAGRNWSQFLNNNIVLITGIPMIIGIHWGWWRIQQNPALVDPKDGRKLPFYSMYKDFYTKIFGDGSSKAASSTDQGKN